MATFTYAYYLALATLLGLLVHRTLSRYRFNKHYKLPIQIPGLPIIGNTLQIPPLHQGLWGKTMAEQYGEMFTAKIGGATWVFLSSTRTVNDLMEKRSAIYSSRPHLPFASGLLSSDSRMLLMPYGPRWRLLRRILHSVLNKTAMPSFAPFQDVESKHLLHDFLERPERWYEANQRYANSVIMSVVFGRRMRLSDPATKELFDTSQELIAAIQPGANVVDVLTWLERLPVCMQWWRGRGSRLHEKTVNVYRTQVLHLKSRIAAGTAKDCFATRFLADPATAEYGETQTYFALGSLMEAGSDTSRMTISQVMAAAASDPRWVQRARHELDRVCGGVGSGDGDGQGEGETGMRLPTFEDRKELRYITATVKEGFRWRPFAQIGLPTMLIQDDEYEGYKFPKGTLFTWNAMAIALDEREYKDAARFWPERWLGTSEGGLWEGSEREVDAQLEDVRKRHWSFGPGRRMCSGYNVGETNVWIAVARVLYCFDFEQVEGHPIDTFRTDWSEHRWAPFPVKITPRSEAHRRLIERECAAAVDMEY